MAQPLDHRGSEVTRFNLVSEPWILCRLADGTVAELSLREVFARANSIAEVVGEVATQTFAITRLLLAILYRALGEGYRESEDWAELWAEGLPRPIIDAYLDAHEPRFDLLHPVEPFFQVADLRTSKGEHKDVSQLIFDLPANNRLFSTRAGAGIERLSFAEAARWLVNAQAFDSSGIKSGAVGDDRVKGGRGYPIGVAWAGLLGGILVEGDTLSRTLLLNLVDPSEWGGAAQNDLPPWERPQSTEVCPDRPPRGPVDLYTWQSRRVRLFTDASGVVGSLVCNGDRLTPQNQHGVEPMTAWRRSTPQEKKLGLPLVYMPLEHDPSRAFWRGISALIPKRVDSYSGSEAAARQPSGVLSWLAGLQLDGYLPPDTVLRLRAIGVVYGTMSAVVSEIVDDRLTLSLAVLSSESARLGSIAEAAVERADKGVRALGNLAANLAIAAGGVPAGFEERAREEGFAALDGPYRSWLAGLTPASDPDAAYAAWQARAYRILRDLGSALIDESGPAAWAGRDHRGSRMNTARAELWFIRQLTTTFITAKEHSA
ncbi:type I-E CRISPR-associated protein Cse1/CasA [Klugiella xanthotipulae]|uniref:CRISPR-associated Cse1 family protein n=1 Tax=Klugiella xanthotipulae TaxID=244735 RepID=A0A543HH02_9MICO|nr:type I-E CRISPR-associated protein Cse1/CasA [Klugiella xanthotipulae]TQM57601.1 CRISPR-associated Cse1 family protein [Klugiella xanthotipulae]